MFEFAVVCCARWETSYIREWLNYYDAIGFDRIYLYCNDDDPSEMAAEVGKINRPDFVEFVHFPGQGQQRQMYVNALVRVREEAEWVAFLDVDEFLALRQSRNVREFMSPLMGEADSVHFNWLNFGNNGFKARPSGSVLRQYTRREPTIHQNTKHISRVSVLDVDRIQAAHHPFWHGLFGSPWDDVRRVTALGNDMKPILENFPDSLQRYLRDPGRADQILNTAVVNHYMLKSEEDFLLRSARGLGGEFSGQAMWQRQYESGHFRNILLNLSQVEDTFLSDFAKAHGIGDQPIIQSPQELPQDVVQTQVAEQPTETVRRVVINHTLWCAELLLGSNGRARHALHGSLASYQLEGDILHVDWDTWPSESFAKRGDEFVTMLGSTGRINR